MNNLLGRIESLQTKLERHRNTDLKETPTRTIFIDPLLESLGWDVENWDDVELEHPTIDGKSVDYALKIDGKAVLLVEAKPLNDPLIDVKAITQVVGYAANDGIEWCILTNGEKYRVYCTREKAAAPEKLLFEVSLDTKENGGLTNQQVAECLSRLSKDSIANGVLDKIGEDFFTKGRIRKALDKLFQEPPSSLIREIRNAISDESIKPAQVKKIIGELWVEKSSPRNLVISDLHMPYATNKVQEAKKEYKGKPTSSQTDTSLIDTVVVPAREGGFKEVFIGENRWYEIKINSSMIPRIRYIAVYRKAPISAVTHVAEVRNIEPWEDGGKYVVNFVGQAKEIEHIKLVPKGKVTAPQSRRYTSFAKLKKAKTLDDLF
jgi:predicted type IV restriction endonuclease